MRTILTFRFFVTPLSINQQEIIFCGEWAGPWVHIFEDLRIGVLKLLTIYDALVPDEGLHEVPLLVRHLPQLVEFSRQGPELTAVQGHSLKLKGRHLGSIYLRIA